MIKVGLLSDTHGYLDENVFIHFKECNEIWHAGDFGTLDVARRLAAQSGLTHTLNDLMSTDSQLLITYLLSLLFS